MGEFERIQPVQGVRPVVPDRADHQVRRKETNDGTGGQAYQRGKPREDLVELHDDQSPAPAEDVMPDQFEGQSDHLDIAA